MAEKIAIVIPAYNAEKSLPRTLESVLRQTHADLEAWVVDDGSADSTAAVAERFAARDPRVRVLRQENAGAYMARLAALKRIDAPWFGFVDADDTIEPDMYEKMLAFAEEHACDVVQCDWFGHRRNGGVPQIFGTRAEVLAGVVRPRLFMGEDAMMVWDKLYRNQYDFSKWIVGDFATHEDLIHNLQLFLPVRRVGYLNEELHHYEVNDGSATRHFSASRIRSLQNTIRARELISARYETSATRMELNAWTAKNLRNAVVSCACALSCGFREAAAGVACIREMTEFDEALAGARCRDRNVLFLAILNGLPAWLDVLALRLAKKVQRIGRLILGKRRFSR